MFKRQMCWASALMAGLSNACVQVTLTSVENSNGVITDYQSIEDEILAWIGVDNYFFYTYMQKF